MIATAVPNSNIGNDKYDSWNDYLYLLQQHSFSVTFQFIAVFFSFNESKSSTNNQYCFTPTSGKLSKEFDWHILISLSRVMFLKKNIQASYLYCEFVKIDFQIHTFSLITARYLFNFYYDMKLIQTALGFGSTNIFYRFFSIALFSVSYIRTHLVSLLRFLNHLSIPHNFPNHFNPLLYTKCSMRTPKGNLDTSFP